MAWQVYAANGALKTTIAPIASADLTGALTAPPPIGTTTPNTGYFSALREYIGGFYAIFTHANSADRTYTFPDFNGTMATLAGTEAFSNKAITASSLIATALSVLIGGFKAIFTHANSADRTYTLPNRTGTVLVSDAPTISLPKRWTMLHDEANVLAGNGLVLTSSASQFMNGYTSQVTAALNDAFTHSVELEAGTYTFSVLGVISTTAGQIDWYIDNVKVITLQDWYTAAPAFNTIKTASVSVTTSGYHQIKGIVAGRNASNLTPFYNMFLTKYWFRPSAD